MNQSTGRVKTHSNTNMTHFMGHRIEVSYLQLKEAFGLPTSMDIDGKVNAHFGLILDDEVVFTIYDWKLPNSPLHLFSLPFVWHIGARTKEDADKALKFLTEELKFKTPSQPHYLFGRL